MPERLCIPAGAVVTVTDGIVVTTRRTVVDGTLILAGNQLNMCDDSPAGGGILNNATIDVTAASTRRCPPCPKNGTFGSAGSPALEP